MKRLTIVSIMLLLASALLSAQTTPPAPAKPAEDYSGMYSFLKEGELIQLTIEDPARVTGFISRYGEQEGDKGAFLNQFFKEGKLEGKALTFTTQTVHDVRFEFKGTVERGPGKKLGDEAYYLLKGVLTTYSTDVNNKPSSKSQDVVFKSFPQDLGEQPPSPQQ